VLSSFETRRIALVLAILFAVHTTGFAQQFGAQSPPRSSVVVTTDARGGSSAGAISPLSPQLAQSIQADPSDLPPGGRLDLRTAVDLALHHNLTVLLAEERKDEARGRRAEARSLLLPNASGAIVQQNATVNLAAQGFEPGLFPGLTSTLIGPFNRFDARAQLVQTIFDLSAIRGYEAARSDVRAAGLEVDLARQQVVEATALAYLNALSTARAVESARANLTLADELLRLAHDRHDAGLATGLDVTRAETRVAQERGRLARATSDADRALTTLLRVVGVPLEVDVTLTDPLHFTPEVLPPAAVLLAEAERNRLELRVAEAHVSSNRLLRKSAQAERLPSLDFAGDYGLSGNTPRQNALPTHVYGVRLNVPIFNGGSTEGRIQVAKSREREAELMLGNVRGQIEEDVRLAVRDEETALVEVQAASQQVTLATRQLEMARDRFAAGVANNIEVVEAQTALADARQAEVASLARYTAARISVAAARGIVEQFQW
jgi:outer membrane protein